VFRSLFFRRLYIRYVLVVFTVALVIGLLGAERLHDAHVEQAQRLLGNTVTVVAHLLQPELEPGRQADLQRHVQQLGRELGYRVTIIGPDAAGTVLADSEANPATMVGHRTRPEVVSAFSLGEGWDIRKSDTIHKQLLYYARRVDVGGQSAFIRLAIHIDDLNQSLRTFYLSISVATVLCMLLGAVVAYHLARRQAAPIVEVTQFADALAKGQLDHRILRSDEGELGILSHSLNSMADSFTRLLQESEHGKTELKAILTSMHEGIVATDSHRRILLVNESAARLLDFPPDAAEGKLIWEVIRHQQIIRAVDEACSAGQRQQFEITPQAGRHFQITVCPFAQTSATHGVVIVVHDISQGMRYQDLRKEFVANVSHELRTPLAVIKGYVETLRDGAARDPVKCDEFLATIERHANQLTNLVGDLLELSKLENQPAIPRRVTIDLAATAHRVVEMLRPSADARGHTLAVTLTGPPPCIVGNADYIERAMINLVDNAIKYTPANSGGKIDITIGAEPPNAFIDISDTGLGIPPEDLPRIFERFYRVDRSRSREMGGTGLGLAIVKHIVQSHAGSVSVQSEPNKGSRFRILLPLAAPPQ
jgi:two-component system, OmpR family, phosphate regulon sensor histidine kinase PhoR